MYFLEGQRGSGNVQKSVVQPSSQVLEMTVSKVGTWHSQKRAFPGHNVIAVPVDNDRRRMERCESVTPALQKTYTNGLYYSRLNIYTWFSFDSNLLKLYCRGCDPAVGACTYPAAGGNLYMTLAISKPRMSAHLTLQSQWLPIHSGLHHDGFLKSAQSADLMAHAR